MARGPNKNRSAYPHGFAHGHTSYEIPLIDSQAKDGNVFWVDSTKGTDSYKGTFQNPFGTIDYAIGRCETDNGDKIMVAEGHAESVTAAGGIAVDVAGIRIIGMGVGDNRGTISFGTAAAASVTVSVADTMIENLRFVCNIASQTMMIDVNSSGTLIKDCEFLEGTATGLTMIDVNGGGANVCDDTYIINNKFYSTTAGNYDQLIELGEVADNVRIIGNDMIGDCDDAIIHNPTGKVFTMLQINDNTIKNLLTSVHAVEIVSACTGWFVNNVLYTDAYATTLDPGSLKCAGNLSVNAVDSEGTPVPAMQDYPSNYIGTDSANNEAATTAVVANADGSVLERLEFVQENLIPDVGGLVFSGTCDTGMGASQTTIVCAHLSGKTDDFFNTKYYMQVIKNTNSVGASPEPEVRQITDYVSATGTFTVTAFGANVEATDKIMVLHESLVIIGRNDADNTIVTTAVVANADGSVVERQEYMQGQVNKIDAVTLAADPVANSLAAYIASGGTALGTELADSKSLVDAIGSTGGALAYGSGSALGAIGTVHVITKSLTSSAILQDGVNTVDVTGDSSGGDLIIEEVTMNTDATGLAAGTNFQLEISGNTYGTAAAIMSEAVANLGATATVGGTSASVTALSGAVLETGSKIVASSTVAACTGVGVITMQIKFRRVAAGATVAAA